MQVLGDVHPANLEMTGYSWIKSFKTIDEKISDIASSSEDEFLSIGEKLQDYYLKADEISKISSKAAGLMVGKNIEKSIAGFRNLLDKMEKHIAIIEGESQDCHQTLQYLQKLLAGFEKLLAGFKQIVNFLHMLGVSIRIESAHLIGNDAGFRNLAGDIKQLAKLIYSKTNNIEEQSQEMLNLISRTDLSLEDMRKRQHSQMGEVLYNAQDSLESLNKLNANSSSAAKNISKQSENISDNINEVVMSMQFHDITRQQMEHVAESVREMVEKLNEAIVKIDGTSHDDWENLIAETGDITELQIAQVRNSKRELKTAIKNITRNLSGITSNVANMSREISRTAGDTNEAGSSFLARIEKEVTSIISLLKENAQANRELSGTMISVAESVGNLSVFVNDIDEISSEIELIALNARIKAARPGIKGETLGVLAEALQKLSLEAHSRTIIFSENLNDLVSIAHELSQGFNKKMKKNDQDVGILLTNLEELLGVLRKINEKIFSLLSIIDETGQHLSGDVESCVSSITVHRRIEEVLDETVEEMEAIVKKSYGLVPRAKPSLETLKSLASRYTMGSERLIHQSMASPDLIEPEEDNFGDIELFGDSDDEDDNIELFGDSEGDDDNIELFDDFSGDENVELFDDADGEDDVDIEIFDDLEGDEDDGDLGDNVELF